MTTIAYDGKVLAADRAMQMGFSKSRIEPKIVRFHVPGVGECGAGATGDSFHCQALVAALSSGKEFPDPERYGAEQPYTPFLLVVSRGRIWLVNAWGEWMRIKEKKMALGGGYEFAIGAMEAGADAITAVKIAARRSTASSGGIDWFEV